MSTSTRFVSDRSLRALWSATSTLSLCCHRPLPIASVTNTNRASTLHSIQSASALARHLSFSQRRHAASSASASAPTAPSDAPADPAAAVYRSIHSKLTESLQPSYLHLEDTSGGCGTFFRLVVASPRFEGVPLVKQHRLVKESIKDDIGAIHGLTIDTMTEAQYKERKKAADERRKAPLS